MIPLAQASAPGDAVPAGRQAGRRQARDGGFVVQPQFDHDFAEVAPGDLPGIPDAAG
ncbi:hypothetical protein D9M72_657180 [compost metagenome]